jgi:hypothetical protein
MTDVAQASSKETRDDDSPQEYTSQTPPSSVTTRATIVVAGESMETTTPTRSQFDNYLQVPLEWFVMPGTPEAAAKRVFCSSHEP